MGLQLTMPNGVLQDTVCPPEPTPTPTKHWSNLEGPCFTPYRIVMTRKFWPRIFMAPLTMLVGLSVIGAISAAKEQGDRLERKIAEIVKNAAAEPAAPRRTPMPEPEVNSYLNVNLKEKIPRGLTEPQISFIGNGRLGGRVFVDIDEFKRQRGSGGILDPLSYVSGRVPLTASGMLTSKQGKGRFQLLSAEMLGIPVPKPLVQELVTFFSRTQENPRGINLDEPFQLPAKIREIIVNPGEAILLQ